MSFSPRITPALRVRRLSACPLHRLATLILRCAGFHHRASWIRSYGQVLALPPVHPGPNQSTNLEKLHEDYRCQSPSVEVARLQVSMEGGMAASDSEPRSGSCRDRLGP